MKTGKHRITYYKENGVWCAAHTYDWQYDNSGELPDEAQDDPRCYCERTWPDASIRRG
jgi:hypothetical protein